MSCGARCGNEKPCEYSHGFSLGGWCRKNYSSLVVVVVELAPLAAELVTEVELVSSLPPPPQPAIIEPHTRAPRTAIIAKRFIVFSP